MEVEAVALETRGMLLEEGKPAQGYGPHFHLDEIGVSKRSEAFARPGPKEKAVAGGGIVKAASWSDLGTYFAYGPEAAWTAPAEEFAARNKAARAEVSAGSKAALAEVSAGSKAAPAEVSAGSKAATAPCVVVEENKAPQAAAGAVKKTKKKLVQVSQDYINLLLAHPPNATLSQRLRSFTEQSAPFAHSNPEGRRRILDMLPGIADSMDEFYQPQLEILRQYHKNGVAYEEIEVDEEVEADEGN